MFGRNTNLKYPLPYLVPKPEPRTVSTPFDFNKFKTNSLSDLNGLFSIFGNA